MEIIPKVLMGRPKKYSHNEIEHIAIKLAEYIDSTDIPILAEFANQAGILREDLYNYDEFFTLRKRAIDKKEAMLERKALNGEIDKTMAIFSLKQLGWSDKHELTPIDTVMRVTIMDDVQSNIIGIMDDIE